MHAYGLKTCLCVDKTNKYLTSYKFQVIVITYNYTRILLAEILIFVFALFYSKICRSHAYENITFLDLVWIQPVLVLIIVWWWCRRPLRMQFREWTLERDILKCSTRNLYLMSIWQRYAKTWLWFMVRWFFWTATAPLTLQVRKQQFTIAFFLYLFHIPFCTSNLIPRYHQKHRFIMCNFW